MKLIGITGSVVDIKGKHVCIANSGKDTLADILIRDFSNSQVNAVKYSIATPLVKIACMSTGLEPYYFTSQKFKKVKLDKLGGQTPRDVLVKAGCVLREKHGSDILLKLMVSKHSWFDGVVVIPDVRTEKEAQYIRCNGGQIIHVIRRVNMHARDFLSSLSINRFDVATESALNIITADMVCSLQGDTSIGFNVIYNNTPIRNGLCSTHFDNDAIMALNF